MIKGSELLGLSLIKDNRIEINYSVKGLIFSKKGFKLLAVHVKPTSRSYKNNRIVPFKKIQTITRDRLIIASENDILLPHQIPEIEEAYNNPIKILGFPIYNHQGGLVGVVKDTMIQKSTGKIIAFIISEGVYDDLVEGYSLLPILHHAAIQKDHVIIGDHELKSILSQGGGLKKLLGIE